MTKPLSPLMSPQSPETSTPRGGGGSLATGGEGHDGRLSSPAEISVLDGYPFSEPLLAATLGLPPRNLTNARVKKLARGRDWELDGGTALLTETGLTQLVQAVGLTLSPIELQLVLEKCRRDQAPPQFTAKIVRFPLNPRLFTVRWFEQQEERKADILVARRDNFRLGMEVPIRLNPVSQRYELAARLPRRKGRW